MSAKVLPQYIAGLSAAFGAFCMGASIGWSAPAEQPIVNGAYGFEVTNSNFGWISSLLTLGATCICIPIGFLVNAIGRKPTMLALIPPYVVGWILMIYANNVTMLYIGRFILGLCGGAFCVTAPIYTTEIAQLNLRGTMGSFFQLLICNGVLYGYVVGAFVGLTNLNILCCILPIIFAAAFIFMPESPVFLVQKSRTKSARQSLTWLRGKDYNIDEEMRQITASTQQADKKVSLLKALREPVAMKGLGIAISLQLFQQLTGINAILFYSTSIFETAGTGFSASLSTIIVGAAMVVATFIAVLIIDKAGRRILLLISAGFMVITSGLMGVYFQLLDSGSPSVDSLGWLPVSSICIFVIFFSLGFGPVPWLISAELFSEDVKSIAGAIAGTSNWLMAFVVTILFPILRDAIGAAPTFWIFTIIAVLAFLYVLFVVPETKGKTVSEIQRILLGGNITVNSGNNDIDSVSSSAQERY